MCTLPARPPRIDPAMAHPRPSTRVADVPPPSPHPGRVARLSSAGRFALAYLLVALVPLLLGGSAEVRYLAIAGAHVLALIALAMIALAIVPRRRGRVAAILADWLPLALVPLMYAGLPYVIAGAGRRFGDGAVQGLEHAGWGGQPAQTLAAALPSPLLSEFLHLAYVSYYAVIYVPLFYLFLRRRAGDGGGFDEAAAAVVGTFVACFVMFVVFPVQGPRYLWPGSDVPDGAVRRAVLAILEAGSSRGAAFPSSHMAVAVVQTLMSYRWRVPGRGLVAVATLGIGVGAVYGGFHYAIDMVAGAIVGVAGFLLVRRYGARGAVQPNAAGTGARAPMRR